MLLIYLILLNLVTFLLFAWDKWSAKQATWRIRERTLLWFAASGGSLGAFAGQKLLRHKTVKQPFVFQMKAIIWAHTILVAFIIALLIVAYVRS